MHYWAPCTPFLGWIVSYIAWIAYMLWAFIPEPTLQAWGVTHYPDKYWALAAPATLLVVVCTYSIVYALASE